MARGSVVKRCPICRKDGIKEPHTCNHREAVYHITYRLGKKQKWKSIGTNKKEAERRLAEIVSQINQGAYSEIKEIAFEDFAQKWLEEHAAIRVKPSTLRSYRDAVRCHFNPVFGSMPIRLIHETDIRRFVVKTIKIRKPKTVNNFIVQLKTMFKHAKRWGYLRDNPAWDIEHVKDEYKEMDFLIPDEAQQLLKYADEPCRTVVQMAVMTGMRRGEIFGLQWGDVDWFNNVIHVRRNLFWHVKSEIKDCKNQQLWRFLSPKTRRSIRSIVMAPSLRKVLEVHRMICPVGRDDLVFCNKAGNPIDPPNFVKREFEPALTRAGLRKIRFHDLRHTYATFLIAQKENIKFIQSQLGHASIQTTLDRYGHILPNTYHGVGERLDKMVFGEVSLDSLDQPSVIV